MNKNKKNLLSPASVSVLGLLKGCIVIPVDDTRVYKKSSIWRTDLYLPIYLL